MGPSASSLSYFATHSKPYEPSGNGQTGNSFYNYLVSHQKVLEGVSSILDDHGFAPTGKGISIGDLECRPYDCKASNSVPKCNYGAQFVVEHDHFPCDKTRTVESRIHSSIGFY
uniref:Uncharacterized protein n=1 Tax=Oryza barthii TaxID=65489 RepID=A0A0D3G2Q7_9ORYZ